MNVCLTSPSAPHCTLSRFLDAAGFVRLGDKGRFFNRLFLVLMPKFDSLQLYFLSLFYIRSAISMRSINQPSTTLQCGVAIQKVYISFCIASQFNNSAAFIIH
jgi:hypothetical protein